MKVYYLNREVHQSKDVIVAVREAYKMAKNNPDIKNITLLVGTKSNYSILEPLQLDKSAFRNGGFLVENIPFKICTLKTYHPNNLFVGNSPSEILVPLCVPAKELYQFEDFSDIACWIVVPWLMSENAGFLSIHEAIDLESGNAMPSPGHIDGRIANGIDWLRDNAYPNQGFVHASDEDYLKSVAVTLRNLQIPINYDQVVYYCHEQGIWWKNARKVAECFVDAQTHAIHTRNGQTNFSEIINAPREN